uniref:Integrase catalytic domain-containing protein n=1 Tax=Fagus sylvatica TaxID=28930 RepID=A0A2N9IHB3_FAGSY
MGRGKVQYLTRKKPKPVETDATYPKWVEENAMVKSWLLNSMTSNVRTVFLRLPTAHDVWDTVSQTYFIGKDASQMYEHQCRAHETRQNGKSLANYYGALRLIWQELDYLHPSAMTCSADAAVQKKEIEEDRLYDFLTSLDPKLRQATMMAVKFHKGSAMVAGASSRPLQMVPDMTFEWFVQKKGTQTKGNNSRPQAHHISIGSQDILTKKLIGLGRECGGLYYLDLKEAPVLQAGHMYQVGIEESKAREKIWLWHRRLGHPSFQYLQYLFPSLFSKVNVSNFHYEPCIYAKNHRVSFPLSFNKSDVPFSLIHTDVWGPSPIPTYTGVQWFVSFINDCTRVQVVKSNNVKEYLKKGFNAYFQQNGTIHQTFYVTTPLQNGIAERKNRHLLEVAQSLCFAMQNALGNPKWKSAMVEEMEALQKNSTWDLVELPEGKKTVGCKWVFTVKHKADGSVERYKTWLVAKGYTQTYGINYHETFALVAKINTIRVLLSLAANLDWPLQQFDVKNTFLHGELEEEVYMDLLPGFTTASDVGKVCNDEEGIRRLRDYLAKEFEMKDLGALRYLLGIEVARSKHGIFLSQQKYVLDLLTETGMLASQPIDTPIEQNHKLGDDRVDQVPTNKERYQWLVGRLIYLSHIRPDLAYAVSVVSQFMHSPNEVHMDAVHQILWYLKSAPGSITDRKSTSGYFRFVGGNLVTWHSKKQNVMARSSVEAEYRAMSHGVCELLWLRILMGELGFNLENQ